MAKRVDDYYMIFPDDEKGKHEMEVAKLKKSIIPARDYIYMYFDYLITRLTSDGMRLVIISEKQYKERVDSNISNSTAPPFKSTEQQLGEFFQPIIKKIKAFQLEVLIDSYNKEHKKRDEIKGI